MEKAPLKKLHVRFSELVLSIPREKSCEPWNKKELLELEYIGEKFERFLVRTLC